jgi:hypothetical protein
VEASTYDPFADDARGGLNPDPAFEACVAWRGPVDGKVFQTGARGTGYYPDAHPAAPTGQAKGFPTGRTFAAELSALLHKFAPAKASNVANLLRK